MPRIIPGRFASLLASFRLFALLYWGDYLVTVGGLSAGLGWELNPFAWAHDPGSLLVLKLLAFLVFSGGLLFIRPHIRPQFRSWPIGIATVLYGVILGWNLMGIVLTLMAQIG